MTDAGNYGHKTYFNSVDWAALERDHPVGKAFTSFATTISRDALRARQNTLGRRRFTAASGARRESHPATSGRSMI